ncbi:MAG: phosphoribosylamine--glycine ligase, partial [Nanoarchaeota archaeon]|nr:phosphoribosylamine--glycine ligase [Nanoarchaeota archaeon]
MNNEKTLNPKKFLFISWDALISDIAWIILKQGHEAKYHIRNPELKDVADGFVPKVEKWEDEVDWADIIVFDDVLGQGTIAKKLRDMGKLVVGGSPYTDRLEDDRAFGQEELKKFGINIIPYRDFKSFDDAISFVKSNPG